MLRKPIAVIVAVFILAVWAFVVVDAQAAPETLDDGYRLNEEAIKLFEAGDYAGAEPLYKRSLAIIEQALGGEHVDVATTLVNLALLYESMGRDAEIEPLLKRGLAIREKELGPDHADVATVLVGLAGFYDRQDRDPEAEPLLKRSLSIREKALGPEHVDLAPLLDSLAALYGSLGRPAEAEPLLKRSLAIREKALGPEHLDVGVSLNRLASSYLQQGRLAEAETLCRRTLAIREAALGPDHSDVATALANLGLVYQYQGRSAEAEPLLKRALAIQEKALGPEHEDVATSLNTLSAAYDGLGRYADAIAIIKRSLAIREKALGPENVEVATLLNNLADQYAALERYDEAEPLFKRAIAIREKVLGPESRYVATTLSNLAGMYQAQERYGEAEPLHKRSVAILEKALDPNHHDIATALNNLALLYQSQGRFTDAVPLYERCIAIYEKSLGPESPYIAPALGNLATSYDALGRHAEAEPLFKRALAILEKAVGGEHPHVASMLDGLGLNALHQGDAAGAAEYWRRATAIVQLRAERGLGGASAESRNEEAQRTQPYFAGLVKATYRLEPAGREPSEKSAVDMFRAAQWGRSADAASSLTQMAARSAKGSPEMASLVRERQDLVFEWQSKDKSLTATRSEPPERRDTQNEQKLSQRIDAIDARLAAIDLRFANDFPDYAALVSPRPLPVAEVRKRLRDDEALVMFLATPEFKPLPEETFAWVVTKSGFRWLRSDIGANGLAREVSALRCGLDPAAWQIKGSACAELTGAAYTKADIEADKPPPFDTARAHAFYKSLLGNAEDLIRGKQLLIVPSAALSQLPFQVLVTAPPSEGQPAAWLVREHALTVLPSVASLEALRARPRPPAAGRKPYVAFANPLLEGKAGDAKSRRRAESAARSANCAAVAVERTLAEAARSFAALDVDATLGASADADALRRLMPVPQTAALVCDVKHAVGADEDDIHLAGRATETEVKAMNGKGALASYAVVNFATHGLVAGELNALTEPGLVLTPPASETDLDNGYLSASEVAALNLDADWVILSACNTAAGGAKEAVALSGLARAFFYAGARALLVSHWSVREKAAVELVTGAIAAGNAGAGRAEALRRSMLALADSPDAKTSHPSYWAPFVVVGEGAAPF